MLSIVQTKKLTHFFKILDVDKNGVWQKQDFIHLAENLCLALNIEQGTSQYHEVIRKCKKMYNIIFTHVPKANSDAISLEYWLDYFDGDMHSIEYQVIVEDFIELTVNNVFEIFDQNHDGGISLKEYVDMFRVYGIDITYTQKGFESLDKDRNRQISREELEVALREFFTSPDVQAKGNWTFGSWN